MMKDETSGILEKQNVTYLSLLQARRSVNSTINQREDMKKWDECLRWADKYFELESKHLELKEYYKCLVEDLKDSISILLKDYIKSRSVSLHLCKYLEKISSLRKEKYELKISFILQNNKIGLIYENINESLKMIENYK